MSEELNWLLTDEFVAFSQKIAAIHERKKEKKQELKEFYEKMQVDIRALDDEARIVEEEFQTWKKSQEKQKK